MMQKVMVYFLKPDIWLGAFVSFVIPFGISKVFHWIHGVEGSKSLWLGFVRRNKKKEKHLEQTVPQQNLQLTVCLEDNLRVMREIIGHSPDIIFRQFSVRHIKWKAAVVYVDGLVDKVAITEQVVKALMKDQEVLMQTPASAEEMKSRITDCVISATEVKEVHSLKDCIHDVLSGNVALFMDGMADVLIIGLSGGEGRSIEEPLSEAVVRGPRDGFVENLRSNTAMLRRRIKDPSFTIVNYTIGRRSRTEVSLIYIKGLTNPELVEEVKERVERIDIDGILESGDIEQLIEDNYLSPFPQVQNTERPDRAVSALMEGRVVLMIDGTPFALIVPITFFMMLTSSEDYYERWLPASLIRIMRYGAAFLALFLPALYIALISYNHGLIPTKLVISIAAGREGVPFPSIVEALIMEITLEILREAGLRLPKPIGQAVGIVGGLVIGQAAVQAAIVSPIMVIVVALTAISSFAFPQYGAGIAIRILRFAMMMAAAVLGLYGIILFFILITVHLVKLKSFGVDYLSPLAPIRLGDWKDFILRMPLKIMKQRPKMNKPQDRTRQ
ncbi:spore germination protein [Paenibacillus sp. LMG 31460]|uniref:Spore germination protein n=1 Tax=Paenibacillus germinis TaxID=2654979 RepID=A0ABX1YWM3_9BACL|nr:spore germination protein [Paenibacillus germinis]NOU85510.1 spore germination protein [Paenibacillus germinis]